MCSHSPLVELNACACNHPRMHTCAREPPVNRKSVHEWHAHLLYTRTLIDSVTVLLPLIILILLACFPFTAVFAFIWCGIGGWSQWLWCGQWLHPKCAFPIRYFVRLGRILCVCDFMSVMYSWCTLHPSRSLSIRPDSDTLYYLGSFYHNTGRLREAAAAFEDALRLHPHKTDTSCALVSNIRCMCCCILLCN